MTNLRRSIDRWRACDPKAIAAGSEAQCMYALDDARSDILKLADALSRQAPAAPAEAELFALLPGPYYMDPPDGGDVPLIEQLRRMSEDARKYRHVIAHWNEFGHEHGFGELIERIQAAPTPAEPAKTEAALQLQEALNCLDDVLRAAGRVLVGLPPSEQEAKLRSVWSKAHEWSAAERKALSTPPTPEAEPAQQDTAEPPLFGRWHHGEGHLVSGTIRIARWDCDTNPPTSFRDSVLDWMCDTLNKAVRRHLATPPAQKQAAPSGERYCNKCGYFGPDELHQRPNGTGQCGYLSCPPAQPTKGAES